MSRLPPSASVAHPAGEGAKLHAPSAERNAPAIVALIRDIAPSQGRGLEIASGTGQHIVALAGAIPQMDWHPSDIAPDRIASIAAHVADAGLPNLHAPLTLDACATGWAQQTGTFDMVYMVNLLHLIPQDAAHRVLEEAVNALTPGGTLMVYGPFMRGGVLTSPGDARFDAELRAADPEIGYKDDRWLESVFRRLDLTPRLSREMPANNLATVATKES